MAKIQITEKDAQFMAEEAAKKVQKIIAENKMKSIVSNTINEMIDMEGEANPEGMGEEEIEDDDYQYLKDLIGKAGEYANDLYNTRHDEKAQRIYMALMDVIDDIDTDEE